MVKKNPASGAKTAMAKAGKAPAENVAKAPRARKPKAEAPPIEKAAAQVAWGLSGQQEVAPDKPAADETTSTGKPVQQPSQVATDGGGTVHGPGANLQSVRTELLPAVEAIERLREEMASLKNDEKEFFDVLKTKGYSAKYLRKVLARRAMDPDKRIEEDDMISMYEAALAEAEAESDEDDQSND